MTGLSMTLTFLGGMLLCFIVVQVLRAERLRNYDVYFSIICLLLIAAGILVSRI